MDTTACYLSSQNFNQDHMHLNLHYKRFLSILWIKEIHLKFHLLLEKKDIIFWKVGMNMLKIE